MCGIAGFYDKNGNSDEGTLRQMTDTLEHRGPDDAGAFLEPMGEGRVGLGHRRLTIIDLSAAGHQPMSFEDLTIVFNGEIYNYEEVKAKLTELGHQFISTSDTEVILHAYKQWGRDCVDHFRGMWAFALFDSSSQELLLCRDRMGVKPLYWYQKNGVFLFGSELKSMYAHPAFEKQINQDSLALFMQYGYIVAPYSIFENAYKVEPGHWLTLTKEGEVTKQKFWAVEDHYFNGNGQELRPDNEVIDETEALLTDGFNLRMVADVPVGVFLSGGIDSTLVTALLQKESSTPLKTFTIGFHEQEYNEAIWAKKVAEHLGTDHTELYCTTKEAFDIIPKLPDLYDEPFGDSSAIPTHLVSQLAKEQVKVALSADGGDEQFCGYHRYWNTINVMNRIDRMPFSSMLPTMAKWVNADMAFSVVDKFTALMPSTRKKIFKDKFVKFRDFINEDHYLTKYDMIYKFFLPQELEGLGVGSNLTQVPMIDKRAEDLGVYGQSMFYDLKTYLTDDILTKVDRATMGVSLEGREPFLDNKIVEYSSRMPLHYKYRDGKSKWILRKVLERYVPNEYFERKKQGFTIPMYEWFKNDLSDLYMDYLSYDRVKREGVLNPEPVSKLLNDYMKGKGVYPFKLWFLFVFQLWYEKHMK